MELNSKQSWEPSQAQGQRKDREQWPHRIPAGWFGEVGAAWSQPKDLGVWAGEGLGFQMHLKMLLHQSLSPEGPVGVGRGGFGVPNAPTILPQSPSPQVPKSEGCSFIRVTPRQTQLLSHPPRRSRGLLSPCATPGVPRLPQP